MERNDNLSNVKKIIKRPALLKQSFELRYKKQVIWLGYSFFQEYALPPSIIFVTINEHCNLKCKTCELGSKRDSYIYSYVKSKQEMPLETFKRLIDTVKITKPEIFIVMVEPLLYPHIIEAVEYITAAGLKSQITTNGTLLSAYAKDLLMAGIGQINVSIDAGVADIHDTIRGVPGTFNRVMDGLNTILSLRRSINGISTRVGINTVISEYNYFQLYEEVKNFKDLDLDFINFTHLSYITEDASKRHTARHPDLAVSGTAVFECNPRRVDWRILDKQIKAIKRDFKDYTIGFIPEITDGELRKYYCESECNINGYSRCYYPWRFSHVLPNGDIIPSVRCFPIIMGNISDSNFSDIWNGKRYRGFRRRLKKAKAFNICYRCQGIYCSNYL